MFNAFMKLSPMTCKLFTAYKLLLVSIPIVSF